eukprot:TRINITY_DN4187_c0_g1_i1.p1 TRINITY_DN4187_c0_g1~~TRINITY_DN4187_c0_g1_i1.p1  ORF type:complete len:479 (+),score=34.83 TRINITY_DN4187_c0_g1_i1:80-1516(+)
MAKVLLLIFISLVRSEELDGESCVNLLQASLSVDRSAINQSFLHSPSTSSSSANASSRTLQNISGVSWSASVPSIPIHMLDHGHRSQEDLTRSFALFTGAHVLYASLAFLYEVYSARACDGAEHCTDEKKSERCLDWDVLKMSFMFGVVYAHIFLYITPKATLAYDLLYSPGTSAFSDQSISWMGTCIPGFTLISGIFGQSMNKASLATCVVKCGVAYVTTTFLQYCVGGFHADSIGERWYIVALPFWRIFVSGLFWVCRRFSVPLVLPLCACFVCSDAVIVGLHNKHQPTFQFLPYFAIGCLFPASSWTSFFSNYRVQLAATVGWLCFVYRTFSSNVHSYTVDYFTFSSIDSPPQLSDVQNFMLKLAFVFSWMGLVFLVGRPFQSYAPKFVDVVGACGTRTVYCYLLHWIFVNTLAGHARVGSFLSEKNARFIVVWAFGMSVLVTFAFSSKLTDRIFRPVLFPDVLPLRRLGDYIKQ